MVIITIFIKIVIITTTTAPPAELESRGPCSRTASDCCHRLAPNSVLLLVDSVTREPGHLGVMVEG